MTIRNVTEPRRDSLMAATYFLRFGLGALPALADRFLDGLGRFVTNPVQYKYILWIFPVQLMYTWLRMRYPDWLRLYELSMLCLLDKFSNTFFSKRNSFQKRDVFQKRDFFSPDARNKSVRDAKQEINCVRPNANVRQRCDTKLPGR